MYYRILALAVFLAFFANFIAAFSSQPLEYRSLKDNHFPGGYSDYRLVTQDDDALWRHMYAFPNLDGQLEFRGKEQGRIDKLANKLYGKGYNGRVGNHRNLNLGSYTLHKTNGGMREWPVVTAMPRYYSGTQTVRIPYPQHTASSWDINKGTNNVLGLAEQDQGSNILDVGARKDSRKYVSSSFPAMPSGFRKPERNWYSHVEQPSQPVSQFQKPNWEDLMREAKEQELVYQSSDLLHWALLKHIHNTPNNAGGGITKEKPISRQQLSTPVRKQLNLGAPQPMNQLFTLCGSDSVSKCGNSGHPRRIADNPLFVMEKVLPDPFWKLEHLFLTDMGNGGIRDGKPMKEMETQYNREKYDAEAKNLDGTGNIQNLPKFLSQAQADSDLAKVYPVLNGGNQPSANMPQNIGKVGKGMKPPGYKKQKSLQVVANSPDADACVRALYGDPRGNFEHVHLTETGGRKN